MSNSRRGYDISLILVHILLVATSIQSIASASDDGHRGNLSPAGSRFAYFANAANGQTEQSNPRSTALTRTADALATLRHLAEDAPFEGYDAERGRNVGELLRYLDGRGRSKLSALINAAEDYHRRSKRFKYADDDEMRVHYEERLIEEFLGRSTASDAQERQRQSVTLLDNQLFAENDTTDWLVCRADYGAFVEPITNSLWNAVRQAVCDALSLPPVVCNALVETLPEKESPPWGRRMIDAMAKIPTAISEGKLSWVGAYDMCENYEVDDNATHQFNGRYCRLDIAVSPDVPITLQLGVCVPNTCESDDVLRYIKTDNRFLSVLLRVLQWNMTSAFCGHDSDKGSDVSYQVTVAVITTSLVVVVLATIYDGCFRKILFRRHIKKKQDKIKKMQADEKSLSKIELKMVNRIGIVHRLELLFIAFSAYSNCRRIFTLRTKSNHLAALDGVRSLSYGYIIWGQTYVWGPLYTESFLTGNLLGALQTLPQSFKFQAIMNFHLAADSFLLISGILVTYGFLKKDIHGLRAVLKSSVSFIVRRYWRLMPALMLAIMAICSTYKYAAGGPFYPAQDQDSENCKVNWWVNLLMLNNLVKIHEQCFGHAWFISLAFQLYIGSLVVVIPLLLKRWFGYATLALLYIGHITCTAILTASYREDFDFDTWYNGYFITPWCRAGPFIIGLAFGILLHDKPKDVKLKPPIIVLLWLVAFGSIVTISCVSYDQFRENGTRWSPEGLAAFDTLSRSVWALAVGWIIVSTQWGYAGIIRDLLIWKLFLPMSRLVYIAMIWHAPIMFGYVYVLRQPMYITTYTMMYAAYAHMFLVLIVGFVMALLWDYPLGIRWQKVVLCRTWFEWIRSGRHKRELIDELAKDLDQVANRQPTSPDNKSRVGTTDSEIQDF